MDYAIDQSFYLKAQAMLDKLEKNQKLQQLASANGIDVKNSTKLTEATKKNIATSVIALMLAKQNNDPRYNELVRYGMDHRKTKIDIINAYKDQANQIISRAKNNDFQTLSGFAESHIDEESSDDDDDHHYQEGVITSLATGLGAIMASLSVATISIITASLSVLIYGLSAFIRPLASTNPKTVLKRLEKIPPEQRKDFSIDVELKWKIGEFLSVNDIIDITNEFEKLVNDTITGYRDTSFNDRKVLIKWDNFDLKYQKVFGRVKHMKLNPNQEGAPEKTTLNYDEAVEYAKTLQSIDIKKIEKIVEKMKKHLKLIKEAEKNSRNMQNDYYAKDIHNYEINKFTRDVTIKKVCSDIQRTIIPLVGNYSDYLKAIIKTEKKNLTKKAKENQEDS